MLFKLVKEKLISTPKEKKERKKRKKISYKFCIHFLNNWYGYEVQKKFKLSLQNLSRNYNRQQIFSISHLNWNAIQYNLTIHFLPFQTDAK